MCIGWVGGGVCLRVRSADPWVVACGWASVPRTHVGCLGAALHGVYTDPPRGVCVCVCLQPQRNELLCEPQVEVWACADLTPASAIHLWAGGLPACVTLWSRPLPVALLPGSRDRAVEPHHSARR